MKSNKLFEKISRASWNFNSIYKLRTFEFELYNFKSEIHFIMIFSEYNKIKLLYLICGQTQVIKIMQCFNFLES